MPCDQIQKIIYQEHRVISGAFGCLKNTSTAYPNAMRSLIEQMEIGKTHFDPYRIYFSSLAFNPKLFGTTPDGIV